MDLLSHMAIDDIQAEIRALRALVYALQSDRDYLMGKVSDLESEIDALQAEDYALKRRIATVWEAT